MGRRLVARRTKQFIDGIFNYCDRWCERCPFTSRCRVFADEQREWGNADAQTRDPQNAAFWEKLAKSMQKANNMLREMMKERGIDPDEIDLTAEEERRKRSKERQKADPLSKAAHRYAKKVQLWFKRHETAFAEKEDELNRNLRMSLPQVDPEAEADRIRDAVEVIRWYEYFIAAKLYRATSKEDEDFDDPDVVAAFAHDANGSAKIALIAMDRSIAAWSVICEEFPDHADKLLDMLALLGRLRRETECRFPDARQFVRPGFDTEGK